MNQTIRYYDEHAQAFSDLTLNAAMGDIYNRFLPYLPKAGKILDAGCGTGRDSLFFVQSGYEVEAFDASREMAKMASDNLGRNVAVKTFQDIDEASEYDGIWACASLLHVPLSELSEVFSKIMKALKDGGVLYASFKHGKGEREKDGRWFTDLDESGLKKIIEKEGEAEIKEQWVSRDVRPERREEKWLNTIVMKIKK